MKNHSSIVKPDKISIDEDAFFEFDIDDLSKHYDEVFGDNKKRGKFFAKKVFQIVLLSNKNTLLILAGSLASVPVNIVTGFYGSSAFLYTDWVLHIIQLIASILFYVFFLRFVRCFLFIHEQGDIYVSSLLTKNTHCSRDDITKAVHNIEYYFCMNKYKYVNLSLAFLILFGIILILSLFIPPSIFEKLIQSINNIINCFYSYFGGRYVHS